MVTGCISTSRIWILTKKLKITRRLKDTITKDFEILKREITTKKEIASTSNWTWTHRVESTKIQDSLSKAREAQNLQKQDIDLLFE